jgi:hypothetical protein
MTPQWVAKERLSNGGAISAGTVTDALSVISRTGAATEGAISETLSVIG